MHIAFVSEDIPNLSDGDHQTLWVINKFLVDQGHRVTTCIIQRSDNDWESDRNTQRMDEFRELGTEILTFRYTLNPQRRPRSPLSILRRLFDPPIEQIFPQIQLTNELNDALEHIRPDAVLALYWSGAAATHNLTTAPRLAILSELPHVKIAVDLRMFPKWNIFRYTRKAALTILDTINFKRLEANLLRNFESVADFASDQSEEIRRLGIGTCGYFINPAHDFGGPSWRERREAVNGRSKLKVLMMGSLGTQYSRFGLEIFANDILPILEKGLGPERAEIHLVGNGQIPKHLAKKLDSPMMNIRGWVESAELEYLTSDIVLVPNPIRLGQRTRVMHALSSGCCVVAHEANVFSAPELVPGHHLLTGENGAELAAAIISVANDASLSERVGRFGREAFEQHYAGQVTVPKIIQELERISKQYVPAVSRR